MNTTTTVEYQGQHLTLTDIDPPKNNGAPSPSNASLYLVFVSRYTDNGGRASQRYVVCGTSSEDAAARLDDSRKPDGASVTVVPMDTSVHQLY
jgi:hypothetical protein